MLKFKNYIIPTADLGEENPLADIKNISYIHAGYRVSDSARKYMPDHLGEGMIDTMLPYMQQDGYNRELKPKNYKAAVLENEKLKAVFLPELGGRLWSLYDKIQNRELLYKNENIRFGNLSLRNAWFCGGVEWNVSVKGHNPLTCSPMFAAVLEKNGDTGLRLYEFERKREIVYSLDIWLPPESSFLIVHIRIENTAQKEKYMYWWSNIAVPQSEHVKIAVPADFSYVSLYGKDGYYLDYCAMPFYKNTDITEPDKSERSYDFFYKTKERSPKFIAAVDKDGYGLLEVSTKEMKGRKLFVWGQGNGGKNWNEFLTKKGDAYIEIQSGLAETQLQHLPMRGNSTWEWTEAFGSLQMRAMPTKYSEFRKEAEHSVTEIFGKNVGSKLESIYEKYKDAETLRAELFGSGWGALKNKERSIENAGKISEFAEFPTDSIEKRQKVFFDLLCGESFPDTDVNAAPSGYYFSETCLRLLEESVRKYPNWNAYYHLGIMYYAYKKIDSAKVAWEKSAATKENAWAYRNLAMLYRNEYNLRNKAIEYMRKAIRLKSDMRCFWVDFAETVIGNGDYDCWLKEEEKMPANIAKNARLRMYRAFCLVRTGRVREAAEIINYDFVMEDIKEGEFSVSSLWYEIYGEIVKEKYGYSDIGEINAAVDRDYPLKELDFRMH